MEGYIMIILKHKKTAFSSTSFGLSMVYLNAIRSPICLGIKKVCYFCMSATLTTGYVQLLHSTALQFGQPNTPPGYLFGLDLSFPPFRVQWNIFTCPSPKCMLHSLTLTIVTKCVKTSLD
ncbi:hypothetical protein CEXT_492021 [Caerostris extrusa]|uniref:Uncharacterized protein n=1 Tax=Caerostris extrusa TaxID=172846 RepID=A0AAV4N675_CAEEX|nr:hypothetical protein CEXT_492021 [Caerostris extrusa]